MPRSRGRRARQPSTPNTNLSSHSSQTPTEPPKLCRVLWLHLLSILRGLLRWLRANFGLKDAVTWLSILLGIAAGSFFFLPRVTVEPSGPYDPSHPTPLIFWIANTNIVPLRNVRVGIGICYIHVEGGPTLQGPDAKGDEHACNGPAKAIIYIERWHTRWLDADEKFEIPVEDGMNPHRLHAVVDARNLAVAEFERISLRYEEIERRENLLDAHPA